MTYSKQTRLFLGALAALVLVIVAYDVWRQPEEAAPALPQVPAEAPPPARRILDKTPLLYEGEFLQNLLVRVRPALVTAHPDQEGSAVATTGFVADADGAVFVSLASDAPRWRLHTAADDVATGDLVGLDAIHGVALLHTTLPVPTQPLPLAGGMPLSAVEPLIGLLATATGGEVRLLTKAGSVSAFDRALAAADLRAGEAVLDADGRLRAFGAMTEDGVRPIFAYEIGEILGALAQAGRHPHPWLGAAIQTIDETLRPRFDTGALVVVHVEPDSPAARAGLRAGVVFVEARAGDRTARTAEGVTNMLQVGQPVEFVPVPRPRGTPKPVIVEVEDRQEPLPVRAHEVGSLGLMASGSQPGVAIRVAPGGAAAARGLLSGDVVEAVDLQAVTSARQLERALAARAAQGLHLVTVRRGLARFFVLLGPAGLETGAPGTRDE